jgi:hypothetical protein
MAAAVSPDIFNSFKRNQNSFSTRRPDGFDRRLPRKLPEREREHFQGCKSQSCDNLFLYRVTVAAIFIWI